MRGDQQKKYKKYVEVYICVLNSQPTPLIRHATTLASSRLAVAELKLLADCTMAVSTIFLSLGAGPRLITEAWEHSGRWSEGAVVLDDSLFAESSSCLIYVYLVAAGARYTLHMAKRSVVI